MASSLEHSEYANHANERHESNSALVALLAQRARFFGVRRTGSVCSSQDRPGSVRELLSLPTERFANIRDIRVAAFYSVRCHRSIQAAEKQIPRFARNDNVARDH